MVISCIESRDILTRCITFVYIYPRMYNIFNFFQGLTYLKSIIPKEAKDLI